MIRESATVSEAFGPRPCRDERAIRGLLDHAFDGRPGVLDEFPSLQEGIALGRAFVIEHAGRVVAHAAWQTLDLVSGDRTLRAAGIGLVTTAPDFRGRGLAGRLVGHCVAAARDAAAAVALLFGEPRGPYPRLGFEAAGRERLTRLAGTRPGEAARDRSGAPLAVRPAGPADAPALLDLYQGQRLRVRRGRQGFRARLSIAHTHAWVAERGGRPVAYCVEGKGRDLRGVVHEWAGAREDAARLVCEVAYRAGRDLWLLSPLDEPPLVAGESHTGPLAQFRILDAHAVGTARPRDAFGTPEYPGRLPVYLWGLDSM